MLHAARAVAATMLAEWQTSTFVPIPPSKIKDDPRHDSRLIDTLRIVQPAIPDVQELVIQVTNTQSRAKDVSPVMRAHNWKLDLNSLRRIPRHFVVFDDLLTGASHFAAMKIVLARKFPNVTVSGLFLARRLRQSQTDDPSA